MSTRSLIVLNGQDSWVEDKSVELVRIYRHCDGYPSGAGMCIAEAMKKVDEELRMEETKKKLKWDGDHGIVVSWPNMFLRYLFTPREDGWSDIRTYYIEQNGTEHGDIEYLYRVTAPIIGKDGEMSDPLLEVWDVDWSGDTAVASVTKGKPLFKGSFDELLEKLSNGGFEE